MVHHPCTLLPPASTAFRPRHRGTCDTEEALDWLEKSYETAPADLLGVNTDADFDSLRSEPRFRELMQRAGIPSGQLAEADHPMSTDPTR